MKNYNYQKISLQVDFEEYHMNKMLYVDEKVLIALLFHLRCNVTCFACGTVFCLQIFY